MNVNSTPTLIYPSSYGPAGSFRLQDALILDLCEVLVGIMVQVKVYSPVFRDFKMFLEEGVVPQILEFLSMSFMSVF